MGLFDRLKGLKAKYDARKAEIDAKAAKKKAEASPWHGVEPTGMEEIFLVREHGLRRDPTTRNRYILPSGDRYIDVNPDSFESVMDASRELNKPSKVRKFTKEEKTTRAEREAQMQFSTVGGLGGILGNAAINFNANAGDLFGGFGGGSGRTSRKQKGGGSNFGGYDFDFIGGGFGGYDIDFIGGGAGGDYVFDFDFIGGGFGGGTSRPRKRKKSGRKR